jgi:hypothetical protein
MKTRMNKIILMLVLLSISIFSFALAEDIEEEELTQELDVMSLPESANYRFEQLAISLENQISQGNDIISEINVSEESLVQLENYVAELELLLNQTKGIDLTLDASELAAEFVSIKKQAITISQGFRKVVNTEIRTEGITEVKNKIAEKKELRKKEAIEKMQEKKAQALAQRTNRLIENLGIDIDENASIKEIRDQIKQKLSNLTDSEKEELQNKIDEEKEEIKAQIQAKKEETRKKIEEKRKEIDAMIQEKKEERIAMVKANIEERKAQFQEKRAEIESQIKEKREQFEKDMLEKRQEIEENIRNNTNSSNTEQILE